LRHAANEHTRNQFYSFKLLNLQTNYYQKERGDGLISVV